jgi:hypothetical protein
MWKGESGSEGFRYPKQLWGSQLRWFQPLNTTLTEVGRFKFGRSRVGVQFFRKIDKENRLKGDKRHVTQPPF